MTIEAKLDETNKLLGEVIRVLQLPRGPTAAEVAAAAANATPAPTTAAPKPAKPKPAAAAPAKAPDPVPEPAVEDDFDSPVEETAAKLTVDDARKALVALQKAKGSAEASRSILKANSLPSLASLKDEQQDLIAKIVREANEKANEKAASK